MSVDMGKQKGRNAKDFMVNITPSVADPDKLGIVKNMSKTGVAFNKQTSRKPLVNVNYLVSDPNLYIDNLEKSKFNSSKYERPKVVDFNKYSSRDHKDSRLPSFMHRIHTRAAIGGLNRKTMELNHFDDSNFAS